MGVSEIELKRIMKNSFSTSYGLELLENYHQTLYEQDCEILEDAEIIN